MANRKRKSQTRFANSPKPRSLNTPSPFPQPPKPTLIPRTFLSWVANVSSDWRPLGSPEGFIPPHYLLKVRGVFPSLRLEPMSEAWLENLLEKHPNGIRHIVIPEKRATSTGEKIVLTADTKELQKFVLKYINDTNAFGDEPIELKPRKKISG